MYTYIIHVYIYCHIYLYVSYITVNGDRFYTKILMVLCYVKGEHSFFQR